MNQDLILCPLNGKFCCNNPVGDIYPFFCTNGWSFRAFIAGSNTVSNMMFAVNSSLLMLLGISTAFMVALQAVGASCRKYDRS